MVSFGLLPAEICWRVWGTPANFNGFRVLAALLHGTLLVGVSETLRRWTEGATYIRHWPTFLVKFFLHIRKKRASVFCRDFRCRCVKTEDLFCVKTWDEWAAICVTGRWWGFVRQDDWKASRRRIHERFVRSSSDLLVHGQVAFIFVVSVCLFVQSFSQPSLIRFRSN